MKKASKDLLETIKLFKGKPVSFIFLRRETSYNVIDLRNALDELIKNKKIKSTVTDHGTEYKVI